jgi:hypothetical protein
MQTSTSGWLHTPNESEPVLTTGQVIRWWESRRLSYNALLFTVGLAAIAGMEWLMGQVVPPGEDAIEPMALVLGVVVYGIMANLCYTLGWVIELRRRRTDPVAARQRGQWMFRAGMLFSGVLTSLPFGFGCLFWIAHRGHAQ